jgi:putative copper resistance protein D
MVAVVRVSRLLSGVQTSNLDLLAQALLVVAAAGYLILVGRLSGKGRGWAKRRSAAFLSGVLCVWVAVGSGVAGYDDTNVTVHIVQHLLLMSVAAPLVVLGRPLVLATQAASHRMQVRLTSLMRGRAWRAVTNPVVAWMAYLGLMWAMLGNRAVYDYLESHPLVHDASHVVILTVGVLYWEPLLGATTARLAHPVKVVLVLANMPFEVLVGVWLRFQLRPITGFNTLSDTQRAGEAFIVGATLASTVWLAVVVGRWAAAAWREEQRALRRPVVEGWTTPWWAVEPPGVSGSAGNP